MARFLCPLIAYPLVYPEFNLEIRDFLEEEWYSLDIKELNK